jgi:hypothetical protein
MKKVFWVLCMMIFLATSLQAAGFKPYPGAKIDDKATKEANAMNAKAPGQASSTIYTTPDPYEKVAAFYKALGKEHQMSVKKTKRLPSGQELKEGYFILDGSATLSDSKLWVKVQKPYIGKAKMVGLTPKYEDVRDVTAIIVVKRK